jgi:SulP family sulfate permease
LAGALAGVFVLVVLLVLGPIVDFTPVASLAGLLIVIAVDLVDLKRIRTTLRTARADALAFVATLLGTFILPLHHAIMLGVGISIVMFLRRARLLVVRELLVGPGRQLREVEIDERPTDEPVCCSIRLLHVEGPLFFGAASELQSAFDTVLSDDRVRALVVRVKRTQGMDATVAAVLGETGQRMAAQGRHLILVGMRPRAMAVLERSGVAAELGDDNLYPTEAQWFAAMEHGLEHAIELTKPHDCEGGCPIAAHVGALARAESEFGTTTKE